jgi:hypothetical protein
MTLLEMTVGDVEVSFVADMVASQLWSKTDKTIIYLALKARFLKFRL